MKKIFVYTIIMHLILLLAGCAAQVGVSRIGLRDQFTKMNRNALNSSQPNERTKMFMFQRNLEEAWHDDPMQLLITLDKELRAKPSRDLLFVLMELSYLEARKHAVTSPEAAQLYLSCAVYAYAYLFDDKLGSPPSVFHPHSRLACDFYNRSLASVLVNYRDNDVRPARDMKLPLIWGHMLRDERVSELEWDPEDFDTFHIAYEFEVKGLEDQYGSFGLGVPIIAVRTPPELEKVRMEEKYLPRTQQTYPVTVFMRLTRTGLSGDDPEARCRGNLELYNPMNTTHIMVGDQKIPLETDFTTPLAYMVSIAEKPRNIKGMINVEAWEGKQGLRMLEPFNPDKIPLVFVHGLMSSPYTWLKMLNSLKGDPEIRERYQFWFFGYPTGNPVLLSAANLRESLKDIYTAYGGTEYSPAMQQMVLVGHSMGGLLSKLMVKSSSNQFWNLITDVPFDEFDIDDENRAYLERMFFFNPLPFVKRVVFVAAPHRGSRIASGMIGRVGGSLIQLSSDYEQRADVVLDTLQKQASESGYRVTRRGRGLVTGIDNLSPEDPSLLAAVELPFPDGLVFHSIIGNKKEPDIAGGSDGVVPYWSSHLDGAETEIIVKSGHNAHTHPLAIEEIKRILREHAAIAQ
jgi:pimeloyl-ACP methyl ester carboxylesterase